MARWASIILCLLGCVLAQPALACSCSFDRQPVAAFQKTPVVFIGTVTAVRVEKFHSPWFDEDVVTSATAYFAVNEALKGITQTEATVTTGGDHGGCGVQFQEGTSYVVFAWPAEVDADAGKVAETTYGGPSAKPQSMRGARLQTSICSLTAELRSASPHLTMIRSFLQGNPQPMIYGRVAEYGFEFNGWYFNKYFGPMRGIEVVANRAGTQLTARTDEEGAFLFQGVDVGEYTISLKLPESHEVYGNATISVTLGSKEEAAELWLQVQLVNRIGGMLLTADGQRPTEQIQVSLIRLSTADESIEAIESRGTFSRNGAFSFEAVPPGQYVIAISAVDAPAKNTPYGKTYYPGVDVPGRAQVFDIKTPQIVADLKFVLPAELATTQVSGIAVDARGKPVVAATIDLYDMQQPQKTVFGFSGVKTNAAGRFTITGFKGRRYQLRAYKPTQLFEGKGSQSQSLAVTFEPEVKPVRLVLDQPGIFRGRK